MKKLTCIILTALMIIGSAALTSCEEEDSSYKVIAVGKKEDAVKKSTTKSSAEKADKAATKAATEATIAAETVGSSELSNSQHKALVNSYDSLLNGYGFEGEVYVTEHNKPIYKNGINYADKKKKIKNNEYTIFRVASITKQFTAAAILLLQERGKLSVKDTLVKYFPEYKSGSKVTLENVLRMQGGLPDYMNYYNNVASFFSDYEKALKSSSKDNRKVIQNNFMGDPMLFTQGNSYKYSNSGYMLLGEIVEKVSGTTYEDFIQKEIFDKLGMKYSGFIEDLDDKADNVAQPYNYKKGNLDVFKIKGAAFACGNIYSNAVDLTKWADGLRNYKILNKNSLKEMLYDKKKIGYGYGLFLLKGGKVAFHTGNLAPYNSIIVMSFGKSEYTCVALSNYNYYATEMIGKSLRERYAAYNAD